MEVDEDRPIAPTAPSHRICPLYPYGGWTRATTHKWDNSLEGLRRAATYGSLHARRPVPQPGCGPWTTPSVVTSKRVAVNARFRLQPASTGVHHWAAAVLEQLPELGVATVELKPRRASGALGHLWEQTVLPYEYSGVATDLPLLSPCNWGPAAVARQALVLHDVAPLVVPQFFSRAYVVAARVQLPVLAHRASSVLTVSERAKDDIVDHLRLRPEKVHVVGHGTRVLPTPDPSFAKTLPERYFAFVGAHDARKNLELLLRIWPAVHAETGAHLVATRRTGLRTNLASIATRSAWYHEAVSPTDAEIAALISGSLALLWPSVYEGFGMPLLEAYQLGKRVISADSGVARDLVTDDDPLLDHEPDSWRSEIIAAAARSGQDEEAAADARRARAAEYQWGDVAHRVLSALEAAQA